MFRKIALTFLVILMVGGLLIAYNYSAWSSDRFDQLQTGSKIANTEFGPIEYVLKGDRGPVTLFLHGTPGGYDGAPPTTEDRRMLVPSRPGYLSTPLSVGRTPAEQARAFVALLDTLEIESVSVMGVSGGGPSALAFAENYPQRTTILIVIEAISHPEEGDDEIPAMLKSDIYSDFLYWVGLSAAYLVMDEADMVRRMIPDPENQRIILNDPDKIEMIADATWSIWPPTRRIQGWQNDTIQKAQMGYPGENITVPTLIIHGTEDTNVLIEQSEQLAQRIPGSRFHIVEGGDHMMPITHTDEITEVLDEFVEEHND